jgi:tRNA nucleotidyltransferase/poly(A) polymerase
MDRRPFSFAEPASEDASGDAAVAPSALPPLAPSFPPVVRTTAQMPVLDRASIDPDADRVVRKLARNGFKAYLVGGCVRDILVGRRPKDFDVATSATPNEIRATFRNCRIIGRRFRLAHVFFGSKIIETSTFRANPRDEDDRPDLLIRRDNVFGNETEDALRRDFTINGLFYDVEREEVIDHVGGLRDLDAKLVRTIGDPDIRFQEDPVRMLRALKFAARLDFTLEPATFRSLLRWRGEISKCAPPRVLEEIYRLLRGGAAKRSFELLVQTSTLSVMSPHLAGLLQGEGAPVSGVRIDEAPGKATVARVEYDEVDPADRDVDDPVVPHDQVADDEDAVEELEARELDDEERAWHRVWFDERPAPLPAAPAPVHITGVGEGVELADRRARAWQLLGQLDAAVAAGRDPANAVAVAATLVAFLPEEAGRQNEQAAVYELSQPLVAQLHITRRDSERLRYLLTAQRRILAARRRGAKPELFGSRDLVEDAHELVGLIAPQLAKAGEAAKGRPAPRVAAPRASGGEAAEGEAATAAAAGEVERAAAPTLGEAAEGAEAQDGLADESLAEGEELDGEGDGEANGDEPRKRRRRRRGGRRHRHGRGGGSVPSDGRRTG